ncbi:hypothetical protein XENOCAPTIV_020153 [Xenoophorus captivus]|uniref:Peptidase C1A propeptide domain-containing protein n=1 Tax=Xenoophorus captivus TaxID=1517983 RepID=A0ABV0RRG4_9TELE
MWYRQAAFPSHTKEYTTVMKHDTELPLLVLAASLSVSLARPHIHPLSSDMVNYINKLNTTWKAGHNFRDVDYGYVKNLCGTLLKGPKLPVM